MFSVFLVITMNRKKVCESLSGLSNDLLNVQRELNQQLKDESASVVAAKSALVVKEKSVQNLRKRRNDIRESIGGLTQLRNDLAYVTGMRVEVPSWSSSSNDGSGSNEVMCARSEQVRIPKTRCGCQGAARRKRVTDGHTDGRTDDGHTLL